jgi:hypothetical protein
MSKFIISEKEKKEILEKYKIISESMEPTIALLFSFAIVGGGVYALARALEEFGKSMRSKISPLKLRTSVRSEKKILLDAFNLNNSRPLIADHPYFVGKKIHFQVYCGQNETLPIGNLYFEIENAQYIVEASPRNLLTSKLILRGKSVENGNRFIIMLLSKGEDYYFMSSDLSKEFECFGGPIFLANHKFYKHIVKDLDLYITDFPITFNKNIETDF